MTLCTICGKKVPKKRREDTSSPYSGFFCSVKCQLSYSDQMLRMMREAELEAESELKNETGMSGDSWASEALDALDQAAANAIPPNGQRMSPEEVAARFLGAFAGKVGVALATGAYSRFAETVRNWTTERARRRTESQKQSPAAEESPKAETAQDKAPPTSTVDQASGMTGNPRQRRLKEPKDLDDLPLEEQREWLLRRFFLPPTATMDEMRVRYKACAKKYHPDNRLTGDGKTMAVVNATKKRLEEIDRELQKASKKKQKAS